MNASNSGVKNRVQLWLRSERAFGLGMVVAPRPAIAAETPVVTTPGVAMPVAASAAPAAAAVELAVLDRGTKAARLAALDRDHVSVCRLCRLCETRTKTVFGEGDVDAKVMFVGEGPGMNEDRTGRPFVGRAGDLLNKMIAGMGFVREQVYIANILKCRAWIEGPPAKDRAPMPDEVEACAPYLEQQVEIIRPRVMVTLGLPAAKHVLQTQSTMGRLRGVWHEWRGIKVMPTYHPSYVLRTYSHGSADEVKQVRQAVWSDLKKVLTELGMALPGRGEATPIA